MISLGRFGLLPMPLVLCACTALQAGRPQPVSETNWQGPQVAAGTHDFEYRLSGSRQVAPVQVFDDGRDTWLQFPQGRDLPAIFVGQAGREQVAAYVRRGPYVRVEGLWQSVSMRGGSLQARADYLRGERRQNGVPAVAGASSADAAAPAGDASSTGALAPSPVTVAQALPATPLASVMQARLVPDADPMAAAGARAAAGRASTGSVYAASPSDGNMRRALTRWAGQAGWVFQPEHWSVDADIPLAGSASFGPDFKQAVRELLLATELSERPLQPCFYSNQVLRIVSWNEACDRSAALSGGRS